jgi:hypothetical protein
LALPLPYPWVREFPYLPSILSDREFRFLWVQSDLSVLWFPFLSVPLCPEYLDLLSDLSCPEYQGLP